MKRTSIHLNNGSRKPLCRPHLLSILVVTPRMEQVTCKQCLDQALVKHRANGAKKGVCGKPCPDFLLTRVDAEITCEVCLDARCAPPVDRSAILGSEVCYRHWGTDYDLAALCGGNEVGWARTTVLKYVDCPACRRLLR